MPDGPIVVVPKYAKVGQGFSRAERADARIAPGRRTTGKGYQSAASWITDLADARKAILLCSWCEPKFNAVANRYRARYVPDPSGATRGLVASGECDGCKNQTQNCGGGRLWVSEEYWSQVSADPDEAKRRWRRAWR